MWKPNGDGVVASVQKVRATNSLIRSAGAVDSSRYRRDSRETRSANGDVTAVTDSLANGKPMTAARKKTVSWFRDERTSREERERDGTVRTMQFECIGDSVVDRGAGRYVGE